MSLQITRLEERIVLEGSGLNLDDPKSDDNNNDDAAVAPDSDADSLTENNDALDSNPVDAFTSDTPQSQQAEEVSILVVSSSINDVDDLIAAANSNVRVVEYDSFDTTLSQLLDQITEALDGEKADKIGFAVHGDGEGSFTMSSESPVNISTLLFSSEQQSFWNSVGDLVSTDGRVDILACDLTGSEQGQLLVAELESLTGVNVAASDDITGNAEVGGDWIMETDGIDVKAEYFDAIALEAFDAPLQAADITLDGAYVDTIDENSGIGVNVGTFAATGGTGPYEYTFLGGAGGEDNTLFTVNLTTGVLTTAADFDFETFSDNDNDGTYNVRIEAKDTGDSDTLYDRTFTITINDVNDSPTLSGGPYSFTGINEDTTGTGVLVSSILGGTTNADDDGDTLGIAVTAQTANGTWEFSSNSTDGSDGDWMAFGSPTTGSALLLNHTSYIRYSPDTLNGETADITFVAWDQTAGTASNSATASAQYADTSAGGSGISPYSSGTAQGTITVNAQNDAPVLDNSDIMSMIVAEDTADPAGDTITSIIASSTANGGNAITDSDAAAVEGLAVIGVDNTNGQWQYTINNGGLWNDITGVTNTSAILLASGDANTKIRFVPTGDFAGTANLTVRAWDQTSGSNGGTGVSCANNGSTYEFSSATETVQVSVTNVNDSPDLDNSDIMSMTVAEDTADPAGDTITSIIASSTANGSNAITDLDAGAVEGLAVIGVDNTNGQWQYTINNGGLWNDITGVTNTSAILLASGDANTKIRFVPTGDFAGTANLTVRAWDQTSGSNGGTGVSCTNNGGIYEFSSATETVQVSVTNVNDVPILGAVGGTVDFVEDNPPIIIDADGTVTDVDLGEFNGGTLTIDITANGTANDRLAINNVGTGAGEIGISASNVTYEGTTIGSFAGGTNGSTPLVITFNSDSSVAAVQELLRNITFENVSTTPNTNNRTVQFTFDDGDGGVSNQPDVTVTVAANAWTPQVDLDTTAGGPAPDPYTTTFTENGGAISITAGSGNTDVFDSDSANLKNMWITLTNPKDGDILTGTSGDGIALDISTANILKFSGNKSLAKYENRLESVTFNNTSEDPDTTDRIIEVWVDDGSNSSTVVATILIAAINDEPALTATGDDSIFTEGDASPAGIFSDSSLGTVESGQDIESFTFTVTNVLDGASELLRLDGEDIALTDGTNGNTANSTFGYTVSLAGSTATVVITKTDTIANYNALINGMGYSNSSDDPDTSDRVFTITTVQDAGGIANGGDDTNSTLSVASTVTVEAVNDEPVLAATGNNPTFTEGNIFPAGIFSAASLGTIEASQNIESFTFTVTNVLDGTSELLRLDGENIALTNGNSGNTANATFGYTVSLAGSTATVVITKTDSVANYNALINGMGYSNSSEDPDTSDRVFTITTVQDAGGTANGGDDTNSTLSVASTVTVTAVNDEPVLTATGDNPTFTEGDVSPAGIFSASSLGTVESGQDIESFTFTVTNVFDGASELLRLDGENIALTNGNSGNTANATFGYTVSLAGSTATVVITKTDSVANYNALINGMGYSNSSEDPDTSDRVFTITTVQDAGGIANGGDDTNSTLSVASTVTVEAVNDEPVLAATGNNPTFTEGNIFPAGIFSAASLGTIEASQNIESFTFTVTNVLDGTSELLRLDGENIALTNGNSGNTANATFGYTVSLAGSTATVVITKTDSVANYNALINGMGYSNSNDDPDTSDRVFTITTVQDAGGTANGGDDTNSALSVASTVTVTAINDTPVLATNNAAALNEGAVKVITNTLLETTDVDNLTTDLTYTLSSTPANGKIWIDTDGNGTINGAEAALGIAGTFKQSDIDAGKVKYFHDGSETVADTFNFTVSDGAIPVGPAAFNFNITLQNDIPVVATDGVNLSYDEGSGAQVVDSNLTLSDDDDTMITGATIQISGNYNNAEDLLNFTDIGLITNGGWNAGTGTLTLNGIDSIANYQAALRTVTYENSNAANPDVNVRTVTFTVIDPNSTAAAPGVQSGAGTRDIDITAINDAPEMAAFAAPSTTRFADIVEDDVANSGTLVSTIVGAAISDADNAAQEGIAIWAINPDTPGSFEYKVAAGSWTALDLAAVSSTNAVVLYDTASIRFIPDQDYFGNFDDLPGNGVIAFYAWDRTGGYADGQTGVNVSARGTSTPFSTDYGIISGKVTPVNDAPVANADNPTALENEIIKIDVLANDTDIENDTRTITKINGVNVVNDTWVAIASTARVRYNSLTKTISYDPGTVYDALDSGDTDNDTFNYTISDGALTDTATVTVDIVGANDAPTFVNLSGTTVDENAAEGTLVADLTSTDVDADDTFTYSLENDAGGRFKITGDQLQVADGTLLDFEIAASHVVRVRTTDSAGVSVSQNFTINLNDINDAPLVTTPSVILAYTEGDGGKALDDAITVTEQDVVVGNIQDIDNIKVELTVNYADGEDFFFVDGLDEGSNTIDSITSDIWINSNGNASLTLTKIGAGGTLANFEALLRLITYQNTSGNPSELTRIVKYTVTDAVAAEKVVRQAIKVTAVAADLSTELEQAIPSSSAVETGGEGAGEGGGDAGGAAASADTGAADAGAGATADDGGNNAGDDGGDSGGDTAPAAVAQATQAIQDIADAAADSSLAAIADADAAITEAQQVTASVFENAEIKTVPAITAMQSEFTKITAQVSSAKAEVMEAMTVAKEAGASPDSILQDVVDAKSAQLREATIQLQIMTRVAERTAGLLKENKNLTPEELEEEIAKIKAAVSAEVEAESGEPGKIMQDVAEAFIFEQQQAGSEEGGAGQQGGQGNQNPQQDNQQNGGEQQGNSNENKSQNITAESENVEDMFAGLSGMLFASLMAKPAESSDIEKGKKSKTRRITSWIKKQVVG